MSIAKKFANRGHEGEACFTSKDLSPHGMGKTRRRVKVERNRAAKRAEERIVFNDWK